MKYLFLFFALFIFSIAHSQPNVKFESDCVVKISTKSFVHHFNLKNIKRIFESNNGTKLDFDEVRIRDITSEDTKDIIKKFVECSQ